MKNKTEKNMFLGKSIFAKSLKKNSQVVIANFVPQRRSHKLIALLVVLVVAILGVKFLFFSKAAVPAYDLQLAVAQHTSPSIAYTNTGYKIAYQGTNGTLWLTGATGTQDTGLGMMSNTSPSITALVGGGYQVAFQANTGALYTIGSLGWTSLPYGMMSGTSPSIATLAGGGYEIAFQANTTALCVYGTAGTTCTPYGMMSTTSPSIAGLITGGYEAAFQANTTALCVYGTASTNCTPYGMMNGTNPSITALYSGGYEVAFQANTTALWVTGSAGTVNTGLGMMSNTSPSIAAITTGGYEVAMQANTTALTIMGSLGWSSLGFGMMSGTSPNIAGVSNGGYQIGFQANTGSLWSAGQAIPPPTVTLSANPISVLRGNSSTLSWKSTNTTSCSAGWTGSHATSGSQMVTPTTAGNVAYSINCSGPSGGATGSVSITANVIASSPLIPLDYFNFSATAKTVTVGQATTLKWDASQNYNECLAQGSWSGYKATVGSYTTPTFKSPGTYTYTLLCNYNPIPGYVVLQPQPQSITITVLQKSATPPPSSGKLPPNNPSQSLPSTTALSGTLDDAAAATNNARAALESLHGLNLNLVAFGNLTIPQQLFVIANIERLDRGLPAALALTQQLNTVAQTGANNGANGDYNHADPILSANTLTGGTTQVTAYGSNWGGGESTALGVNYDWMYNDGQGGTNLECTATDTSGCWGHRINILSHYPASACPNGVAGKLYMGTANNGTSYAEIFVGVCGNTSSSAPTDQVFTWAQAKQQLGL